MPSKRKRRVPRNIYTEQHADREFQDFIKDSISRNMPVPEGPIPSSRLPQEAADNHQTDPKRHELALPLRPVEVCHFFRFFYSNQLTVFP